MKSLLIIDDDRDVLQALTMLFEDEFDKIICESMVQRVPALIAQRFSLILLDMNFSAGVNSGNEGLYWLDRIRQQDADASVVLMTAYGDVALAVEGMKRGAKDFVLKPWQNEKMLATVKANVRRSTDKPEAPGPPSVPQFVYGASEGMIALQDQIQRVAATDASVLILGENGTGKDLVARELHRLSHRSTKPFVSIDLSSIAPTLFESELFGHRKGAFTDAHADRQGKFEMANGGTIFLDEIGNLSLELQAKLLTVLQKRELVAVGANTPLSIDVRVISATNSPVNEWAKSERFRMDLLYRLNIITLTVPPLRDRGDDVVRLALHFLEKNTGKYGKPDLVFDDAAKAELLHHPWPGNVRELEHTIEKAVILAEGTTITREALQLSASTHTTPPEHSATLDELEKKAIAEALKRNHGNIVQASKALGITRQTLYNKMKRYGL